MTTTIPPSLLGPNNYIKNRWKVVRKIGQGAFGEIYSAKNIVTSEYVAIKMERVDSKKQVLKLEVAVLKKLQTCPYVVTILTCGRHNEFNFMVMELLGENISELRRRQPNGRFSMLTTLKLGIQMLKAIESIHDLGYLHRDVKPSNYAMGLAPHKKNTCFLIDFGLSRRYLLPNGDIRPARDSAGFRGTARYASINSHKSKDLSRRDDLWSLFYILVEFAVGQLPWRRLKDKDQVGEMKIKIDAMELVKDLPNEFTQFLKHIQGLKYAERPNYAYLLNLLNDLFVKNGGDDNTPFDWESPQMPNIPRFRPVVPLAEMCFIQLVLNIDKYNISVLPSDLKRRVIEHLIRLNNGKWNRQQFVRLLDASLQKLSLKRCEFESEELNQVLKICSGLRSVTLSGIADSHMKDVLLLCPSVERLSLCLSRHITNKSLKLISESCNQLKSVKVRDSERVSDKGVEILLKAQENLTELSLSGAKKFKGTAFKPFSSLGASRIATSSSKKRNLHLQKLDLSGCSLSKSGFKYLSPICSDLQILVFNPLGTSFKITSGDFLALLINCPNLLSLNLSCSCFEMDTILIEISRYCPRLHTLLLDGIGMTDYGIQRVVQNCSNLHTLRFRYGDGVTDSSLQHISKSCTRLKSLSLVFWNNFNRMTVSDQSIQSLLQHCTNLTHLNLKNCLIPTGTYFPEFGYFPYLEKLDLSECVQLNDQAIRRIAESCPALKCLKVKNLNNLTNNSLEVFPLSCPLLEELKLNQCSCFKDEAIKGLLFSLQRLFVTLTRYVDVELKGITKEVHYTNVDAIFSKFPNTYRDKAFDKTRKRMFGMEG